MRLAEPLWDRATHDALVTATAPKRDGHRAPKGMRLLTGAFFCGNCGARLHVREPASSPRARRAADGKSTPLANFWNVVTAFGARLPVAHSLSRP